MRREQLEEEEKGGGGGRTNEKSRQPFQLQIPPSDENPSAAFWELAPH